MGSVCLNVIGIWHYGFNQPMWIMTSLEPEAGLALYEQHMKIEICFRDLKSLLQIDKVMHKSHQYLDKMLARVMLAYAICLLIGETIRDGQYGQVDPKEVRLLTVPPCEKTSRWHLFSGPFLLLKQRYRLNRKNLRQIVKMALLIFIHLIYANIRSLVRT